MYMVKFVRGSGFNRFMHHGAVFHRNEITIMNRYYVTLLPLWYETSKDFLIMFDVARLNWSNEKILGVSSRMKVGHYAKWCSAKDARFYQECLLHRNQG